MMSTFIFIYFILCQKVVKQNQKPEFLEAMNRRILEHHEASKQSDRTYKQKLDLVDMLFQILVELYPSE